MQLPACASRQDLNCRRRRWTPGSRRQIQATGSTSSSSPTTARATATPPQPPLQVLWLCLTLAMLFAWRVWRQAAGRLHRCCHSAIVPCTQRLTARLLRMCRGGAVGADGCACGGGVVRPLWRRRDAAAASRGRVPVAAGVWAAALWLRPTAAVWSPASLQSAVIRAAATVSGCAGCTATGNVLRQPAAGAILCVGAGPGPGAGSAVPGAGRSAGFRATRAEAAAAGLPTAGTICRGAATAAQLPDIRRTVVVILSGVFRCTWNRSAQPPKCLRISWL